MTTISSIMISKLLYLLCTLFRNNVFVVGNMNGNDGQYKIANGDTSSKNQYSTDYDENKVEYFDVYSNAIKTRYSEVDLTMQGPIPLPGEIQQRFSNGKTMAIIGYEVDQVQKTSNGDDVSLPITFAYNHHYEAFIANSQKVEFVELNEDILGGQHRRWTTRRIMNKHGQNDITYNNNNNKIPHHQLFSEGNGGEFRLSYHGYPKGYAQLIQSPDVFRIVPMHIDTWNRDEMNISKGQIQYKPGPLPKSSRIPPSAGYSGLIECPCSDRLKKEWSMQYVLSSSGTCNADDSVVQNSTECFTGAKTIVISNKYNEQSTKDDTSKPYGCSVEQHGDGTTDITWNSHSSQSFIPSPTRLSKKVVASAKVKDVTVTVTLNTVESKSAVTIKISGPANKWFGIGFGSNTMCMHMEGDECPYGGPYAIIISNSSNDNDNDTPIISERKLDYHGPGNTIETSLTIVSHNVTLDDDKNQRLSVVLTRTLKGMTEKHYTFDPSDDTSTTIPIIVAQGCSTIFAQHCGHGSATLNFLPVGKIQTVCRNGIAGTIGGRTFNNSRCLASPAGDLLEQNNPTCFIQMYLGGTMCCNHGQSLLDTNQDIPWPDQYLEYYLKFRFYFEEYKDNNEGYATSSSITTSSNSDSSQQQQKFIKSNNNNNKPSHQNLIRLYWMTEQHAGEYDIPKCDSGLPPSQCVHVITSRFKVRDMIWDEQDISDDSSSIKGVKIIYAGPHCHAPSCISMDLYNADTGRLLCHSEPIFGTGGDNMSSTLLKSYNENKFISIPPCLFGSKDEGLIEPDVLYWNTTLLSIKRNNNTIGGHTGEMASWQMRGIVVVDDDYDDPKEE